MVALARKPAASPEKLAGASLAVHNIDHGFILHGAWLPVLENVSFQVEPGEFVALLGPSGCGKSTLLRLVAGLDRPRRGSLAVDGVEVTGPDPSRVVVFQDPTLYPWRTVWRNASLGLEARGLLKEQRGRVDDALALVGLEKFAKAFPHQLSGGMAQRASLARALVNDPTLLILDEPLGKLDSLTRLTMQGELVAALAAARLHRPHGDARRRGGAAAGEPGDRLQRPAGADTRRPRRRPALSAPPRSSGAAALAA